MNMDSFILLFKAISFTIIGITFILVGIIRAKILIYKKKVDNGKL